MTVFNLDEKGSLTSCHQSNVKSTSRKVFLLLLTDGLNSHYCLVTNFQHFMHTLCRSSWKAMTGPKAKSCVNCMQSIGKVKNSGYDRLCEENQPLRIVMRNEDSKLNLNNWEKTQKSPFVVYADLEALNFPGDIKEWRKTVIIEKQYPASYGAILLNCRTKSLVADSFYRCKDCISKLMKRLRR